MSRSHEASRERSSSSHHHPPRQHHDHVHHAHLSMWFVDASLLATLFVAPLFMGGRHTIGVSVYIALAACLAIAAAVRWSGTTYRHWQPCRMEWLWGLALVYVLFQIVPLPAHVLGKLSPAQSSLLPLWSDARSPWFQFGDWETLSLTPHVTAECWLMLLAYGVFFFVFVARVRTLHDVHQALRWIAIATVAMALLGLAQFFFGNGKFLWVYEHPTRLPNNAVKGPFVNQNHFGHLMALGIGPLLWWLQVAWTNHQTTQKFHEISRHRWENGFAKPLLAAGLGVVLIAGLLAFSRGGCIAILLATLITVGLFARCSLFSAKAFVLIALVGGVVVGALAMFGHDKLSDEFAATAGASSVSGLLDSRYELWVALLNGVRDFPLFGTGAGSHAEVWPLYYTKFTPVEYTHAESGYLQLQLETGALGVTLMLIAIGLCFRWCWQAFRTADSAEEQGCAAAIFAGLATSAAHSVFDFVWYIPACLFLTLALAALAFRLSQLTTHKHGHAAPEQQVEFRSVTFAARWGLVGATALIAAFVVQQRVGPTFASESWERYFRVSYRQGDEAREKPERTQTMLADLRETVRRNPGHARAHVRLAGLCLRRFEQLQLKSDNPMALNQIREAALASNFSSSAAQWAWIKNAVGEHHQLLEESRDHARRALRLCPLHGEAYIYLSELAFLETNYAGAKHDYIVQAMRVRPNSGTIWVAAGAEAALSGNTDVALRYWKQAFAHDPSQRARIIELLAPRVSAKFMLETFQPDFDGLERLLQAFPKSEREEDWREVAPLFSAAARERAKLAKGNQAADLWTRAKQIEAELGNKEQALQCARHAAAALDSDVVRRRELAVELINNELFEEAIAELQWCLSRRPDDPQLKVLIASANKRRNEFSLRKQGESR